MQILRKAKPTIFIHTPLPRMILFIVLIFLCTSRTSAKIHRLSLVNDERAQIELSDFGFISHGQIEVEISNFSLALPPEVIPEQIYKEISEGTHGQIGFTLSKGDEVPEFVRTNPNECFLDQARNRGPTGVRNVIFFVLDLTGKRLNIHRTGPDLEKLEICPSLPVELDVSCPTILKRPKREETKRVVEEAEMGQIFEGKGTTPDKPLLATQERMPTGLQIDFFPLTRIEDEFATSFGARFWFPDEEGHYYLLYHNCRNYLADYAKRIPVDFTISITEKNEDSYLPAGEIPKPALYFGLAALFFATGIVWVHLLKSGKDCDIYKIHYLMTALVFLKSCSLLFHGVNFYFISLYGHQQEVWAIVFYVMHLLKGALLFGTIILIGTGWTFFKNFLTEKDRKLFMIVIPLQVLDNVALIIIEESESGQKNHLFWMRLFIFIDLLCCAAVILPVIWSIRHLQEASQTDGKAAFNLEKLRIFRHFYIVIICYIYLTRIIKYLVVFTVPFKYSWLEVVVEEVGTWVFFFVTGFKFKPAPNNPYLKLSQSAEDLEMDEAVTQSGALEGVSRIRRSTPEGDDSDDSEEIWKQSRSGPRNGLLESGGPDIGS